MKIFVSLYLQSITFTYINHGRCSDPVVKYNFVACDSLVRSPYWIDWKKMVETEALLTNTAILKLTYSTATKQ